MRRRLAHGRALASGGGVRHPPHGARPRGPLRRGAGAGARRASACHLGVASWRGDFEALDSAPVSEGAASGMSAVIEIQGLRKAFRGHLGIGRKAAVDGLDLSVRARRDLRPARSQRRGQDDDAQDDARAACAPTPGRFDSSGGLRRTSRPARRLGFLPENPYFYDYLTAEEFLDLYGRLHGLGAADRKRRIESALARVGLDGPRRDAAPEVLEGDDPAARARPGDPARPRARHPRRADVGTRPRSDGVRCGT